MINLDQKPNFSIEFSLEISIEFSFFLLKFHLNFAIEKNKILLKFGHFQVAIEKIKCD